MNAPTRSAWPFPRWIAHRGAGQLAPENTLAAMRVGAGHGYRMFECDVKLSADGVPFLLHDATLERTTDAATRWRGAGAASGLGAGAFRWEALSRLDAGSWHSPAFAGEPLATLEAVARFCLANQYMLNIEIKPVPGAERQTGEVVANEAARLWAGQSVPPLLSSFEPAALQAALAAQPALPRALLVDRLERNRWIDCLAAAKALQCHALVCHHGLWNSHTCGQATATGLRTLAYTVNTPPEARRLVALGLTGIITDSVDTWPPTEPQA